MVVATVLALVLIPLALGAIAGVGVRLVLRGRLTRWWSLLVLWAAPVAALLSYGIQHRQPGAWDLLFIASGIGCGLVFAAHSAFADGRRIALTMGTFLVALLGAEIATRRIVKTEPSLPPGPPHWDPMADLSQRQWSWEYGKRFLCGLQYPTAWEQSRGTPGGPGSISTAFHLPQDYVARPDARRVVLHVGDSMVFGAGVDESEKFTSALNRLEPESNHINAGISGTGPDAYLIALRRWVQIARPALVVMHITELNDLRDLDDPYPCCEWGPLLSYDETGAHERCPTPRRASPVAEIAHSYFAYSPAPFVARALARSSRLAAWIVAIIPSVGDASREVELSRLPHFRSVIETAKRELEQQGIGLAVVVLPDRPSLEGQPHHGRSDSLVVLLDAARATKASVLDPWDRLEAAAGQHLPGLFGRPGDPHFGPAGHELMARWLHDVLPARP